MKAFPLTLFFLIFSFIPASSNLSSSRRSEMVSCSLTNSSSNSNHISLKETDAILILSVEPITISLNVFVLLTYIFIKDMRSSPADLLVAIAFMDLFQSSLLISNSVFYFTEKEAPRKHGWFCQITGYLQIIITYNEIFYNTSFAIFLILKVKYLFKPISIPNSLFHIIIILIDVVLIVEIGYFSQIGKTLNGICGLEACSLESSFQQGFKFLLFLIISIVSLWYFRKKIPKQDLEVMKLKSNFLDYYYLYVKVALLGYTLTFLISSILILNIYNWQSNSVGGLTTLDHIIRLVMSMCLSFIRLRDPFIRVKINRLWNIFLKKQPKESFIDNQEPQPMDNSSSGELDVSLNYCKKTIIWTNDNEIIIGGSGPTYPKQFKGIEIRESKNRPNSNMNIELMSPERANLELIACSINPEKRISVFEIDNNPKFRAELLKSEALDGNTWFDLIGKNIRMNFTCSILTGILVAHHRFQKKRKQRKIPDDDYLRSNSLFFREKMRLRIKEKYLTAEGQEEEKELLMTVHSGHMFNEILEKDRDVIDIENSLNIVKNYANIEAMNKSEGGKSGEFFFSSYDNKLLIKTIKKGDLDMFSMHFADFYHYLTKKNRKSLITPIYGVYSFERVDIAQVAHVIMMRNIVDGPKIDIKGIYDLKGSSYDREVLKKKKKSDDEGKIIVLKDLDFLKIEKKLYLKANQEAIKDILSQDAIFLKDCGLIDYSLLVIKINRENKEDDENFKVSGHFKLISSSENISYHIGIIDYFQKYDLKKIMEKYAKKMMKLNLKLDTSSQDPESYAKRFINFMNCILEN